MILLKDVLNLHELSIKIFGGSLGIRDIGLLESAIARPFQTFVEKIYIHRHLKKRLLLVKAL